MDLTKQPPRRPSNTAMAGIAALARMADKARAHKAELLGAYKYGDSSGLDVEVLGFIGMSAEEFADAAEPQWDAQLADLVLQKAGKSRAQIDAFNREHLERLPQDDLHRRLLAERVAKYAPGRTDIHTVFASIELDDWGAFRDADLTARPPRTPFLRSVLGIAGAARMADKARARRAGKLGDYKYGEASYIDRTILERLGLGEGAFEEAAWRNPNDAELGEWIGQRVDLPVGAVAALNALLTRHGLATPGWEERFRRRRDEVCPDRPEVTTYYEMMDIDDQQSFGIVDLTRRPPRSPYDTSLAGIHCLARLVDKGRAHNAGCLGSYWYGQDSGFDRSVLEFLGLTQDQFAEGLKQHATDEAVLAWLGDRVKRPASHVEALNRELRELAPTTDRGRALLPASVRRLDPSRWDIDGFMAVTELDDEITFARLRAQV